MYHINENFFHNFTLIIIKTALLPGKWLKNSKYVLIFEIGWWEVGFYSPLTDRRTDRQTDGQTKRQVVRATRINFTNHMLGFAYLQITFLISIGLQWTDKKMDRPTQIHLRYYSYVGYCIDTNNFFNFDWIATKIALLPGKWLKNSKYELRFQMGWWEVGFYKPLTDGRTDKKMDRCTHLSMNHRINNL